MGEPDKLVGPHPGEQEARITSGKRSVLVATIQLLLLAASFAAKWIVFVFLQRMIGSAVTVRIVKNVS